MALQCMQITYYKQLMYLLTYNATIAFVSSALLISEQYTYSANTDIPGLMSITRKNKITCLLHH